jgi:hypothetical protein
VQGKKGRKPRAAKNRRESENVSWPTVAEEGKKPDSPRVESQ